MLEDIIPSQFLEKLLEAEHDEGKINLIKDVAKTIDNKALGYHHDNFRPPIF